MNSAPKANELLVLDLSDFTGYPKVATKSAEESLSDARIGLGLFIDEAERALATSELTVDQRIHVATIVSFIDGLAKRLDVVRQPGFVHPRKR